jgi:eukaryotic-like serine/threonine-protein kinase
MHYNPRFMALTPGSRLGGFEILGSLGAGGMGEVYRARDTTLGRDVAIKILPEIFAADPDRLARFEREARTLASLNHPNIAGLYGVEHSGHHRALVMELVEGETLAERIARGPVPVDEALVITRQLAEALEAAHEQGIIHRDLKPANIKLRPDGAVKVLDFGLAKAMSPDATRAASGSVSISPTITSPAMTAHGLIIGTAAYMAPEQAKGRPVGKRADLWALGCILYEMLTGRRPFDGEEMTEVLAAVIKSDPDFTLLPGDIPPSVERLIRGCLEKDPRRRAADASIIRYVLDQPAETRAQAQTSAPASPSRRVAVFAAAAVAALTIAAAAAYATAALTKPVLRTARFSAVPSDGLPFAPTGSDRDIAVTPDGRRIVYRSVVGDRPVLVVRDVNQLDSRVLEGTDGGRGPFVSPDGKWVGFFTGGQLKKVSVDGGPAVTLCNHAGTPRGGSWRGDTIFFGTSDVESGILMVPAGGGEPKVLSTPDSNNGELDHLFPAVTPDGAHVLFTASMAGSMQAIVALNLQTNDRKVLVEGASQPQYLAPGVLVYSVEGHSLRAGRFDLSRMEFRSEAVPVLERVTRRGNGAANYAVSDDGLLVYVSEGDVGQVQRSLLWLTPDGREEPVQADRRAYADPRLSADGRHAAVEVWDATDDVWSLDLERGTLTRQSFETGEDETPAWMPDAVTVVYASSRAGVARAIHRKRIDGAGGEEVLWSGTEHVHLETITPDGKTAVLSLSSVQGGPTDLVQLPLEGDRTMRPLLQSRFSAFGARLSPDGQWMAYSSNESGRAEVYVAAFPSLDRKMQVSTAGGAQPVWSRSGHELYFVTPEPASAMMAVPVRMSPAFTLGQPRKLFDYGYYQKGVTHTGYDVARDGRFIVVKDVAQQTPLSATGRRTDLTVVLNWFEELITKLPADSR